MMKRNPQWSARAERGQRGVSLLFSLMGLVVLSLGAVALIRSVDTGLLVLGNLGFKQDSLAVSSLATEKAIEWLGARTSGDYLFSDHRTEGYSSVAMSSLEVTGPRAGVDEGHEAALVDWDENSCDTAKLPGLGGRKVGHCMTATPLQTLANGVQYSYVITRLCAAPGDSAGNDCVRAVELKSGTATTQRGSLGYGSHMRFVEKSSGTYYRVIARVKGTRGAVSFSETLVHF